MRWSPDQVGLLKVRWAQGKSATQIASELGGGVTRNAVISKIHRLELPKRLEAAGGNDIDRARRVKGVTKANAPAFAPTPIREKGAARGAWNVRYADKSESHCLMFVGGESRDTGFICGRIRQFDKPYCIACSKLCYVPAPEMKRRVA